MPKKNWKKNDRFLDFLVTKSMPIDELQLELIELTHEPTGAEIIHLKTEDPENLFCISFKTIPDTSNGVAHILEHTVLCGSKKYPIKDPFFSMTRRSLNTFMNAFTGSDFTCYPAATQVKKDFYNLLDVYLDAVFYPEIKNLSFLQEGIRLEFKEPENPNSPLEYKGIVFNEMKGVLASPAARLHESMMAALFDELTYGINSGGDPSVIPSLSHKELVAFHKKFYHPSRSLFFFYGNLPLEEHLKFLKERVLDKTKRLAPLPPLKKQTRFKKPKYLKTSFPLAKEESEEKQTYISMGWVTESIENQEKLLAIALLLLMIMDNDASPLKIALLKSGLIAQASIYMDSDISEAPIVLTLQGCEAKNLTKIRKLVFDTLKKISKEGIDKELIENAFHQLEFHRSEITGDQYPFGLSLFMRCSLVKQHGANPETSLQIHSMIDALRKSYDENLRFFEDLLEKYLIKNTHHVEICMTPDKELADKEKTEEEKKLELIKAKLQPKEVKAILQNSIKLKKLQDSEESKNVDCLPKLTLKDVPKKMQDFLLEEDKSFKAPLYTHSCFTNHIVYADVIYPLPKLTEEELFPLKVLAYLIPQLGFKGKSYKETLKEIQANTGGISVNLSLNTQANDFNDLSPVLCFSGKSLYRKADAFFKLLGEMIASSDFEDTARIKEALTKHWTSLKSRFNSMAMRYATNLAISPFSTSSKIQNSWNGLEYYKQLKDLMESEDDKKLNQFIMKLKELRKSILSIRPDILIGADAEFIKKLKQFPFFKEIGGKVSKRSDTKLTLAKPHNKAFPIASPVAFIAKAIKTIPYTHEDAPYLAIASSLFDNVHLHQKIREEGGAYGGGSSCYPLSGHFVFTSYRDPHIANTLKAFEEAVEIIRKGKFSARELEEAKLENIQSLDAPISPGSRSDVAYGFLKEGRTYELRKRFRDSLLKATKKDVIKAIENHIVKNLKEASIVVFAGDELIENENTALKSDGKKPLEKMTF